MASKFYAGMTNVVEALNQMWAAFSAGPFNALPLTGGSLTGPVASTSTIAAVGMTATTLTALTTLTAGPVSTASIRHQLYRNIGQSGEMLFIGRTLGTQPCIAVTGSNGEGGWSDTGSVLFVGKNGFYNRSISTAGTINTGGADYAEYVRKCSDCGEIIKGQVVGLDANGLLTDLWDRAIAFIVKSTDPSFVGGDTWSQSLGPRPLQPCRIDATDDDAGENDLDWAVRYAAYVGAVADWDAAHEAVRQTVDRIAFAGQVPVNVLGATPGQYIVPIQDGDGITGAAMHLADMSMAQYANAVGKVIAIEEDGRARIIVKVA